MCIFARHVKRCNNSLSFTFRWHLFAWHLKFKTHVIPEWLRLLLFNGWIERIEVACAKVSSFTTSHWNCWSVFYYCYLPSSFEYRLLYLSSTRSPFHLNWLSPTRIRCCHQNSWVSVHYSHSWFSTLFNPCVANGGKHTPRALFAV